MSKAKSDIVPEVEAYIAAVPEPARTVLQQMRAIILTAVPPESTEGMSYAMPAFRYKGVLVSYGAFANHCSLFPMGSAVLESFGDELREYRTSKGTLRFQFETPLPANLIRRIVRVRVQANEARQAAKKKSARS